MRNLIALVMLVASAPIGASAAGRDITPTVGPPFASAMRSSSGDAYLDGFRERMAREVGGVRLFNEIEPLDAPLPRDGASLAFAGPTGDLDGDGSGDVLTMEQWYTASDTGLDVVGRSGKTGSALWRAAVPEAPAYERWFAIRDLTGDGALDVAVIHLGSEDFGMTPLVGFRAYTSSTSVVDGRQGRLAWSNSSSGSAQYLGAATVFSDMPWTFGIGDHDGDGTEEIQGQIVTGTTTVSGVANGRYDVYWHDTGTGEHVQEFRRTVRNASFPTVFAAGDLTGDGRADLLELTIELPANRVGVLHADGSVVWRRDMDDSRIDVLPLRSAASNDLLGYGGPLLDLTVRAIAGDTGAELYAFDHPVGYNPAYIEDVDGDGGMDLFEADRSRRSLEIFSGADRRLLASREAAHTAKDVFAFCCIGDVDGDGVKDVQIALTDGEYSAEFSPERIAAFSGATLEPLWEIEIDPDTYERLPQALAADIDGNGTEDVWEYRSSPITLRAGEDLRAIGTIGPSDLWWPSLTAVELGASDGAELLVYFGASEGYTLGVWAWGNAEPVWSVVY